MERIWLKEYPPGVPAEIDPDSLPLAEVVDRGRARTLRRPRCVCADGPAPVFRGNRPLVRRIRCLVAETGIEEGRSCRADDAQPAAVPDRAVRGTEGGAGRGQYQSPLYSRRAALPDAGLRGAGHRRGRELRQRGAEGAGRYGLAPRYRDRCWRPARLSQERARELRRPAGAQEGAGLEHPRLTPVLRRAAGLRRALARRRESRPGRPRLPAVHRAERPVSRREPCSRTTTW